MDWPHFLSQISHKQDNMKAFLHKKPGVATVVPTNVQELEKQLAMAQDDIKGLRRDLAMYKRKWDEVHEFKDDVVKLQLEMSQLMTFLKKEDVFDEDSRDIVDDPNESDEDFIIQDGEASVDDDFEKENAWDDVDEDVDDDEPVQVVKVRLATNKDAPIVVAEEKEDEAEEPVEVPVPKKPEVSKGTATTKRSWGITPTGRRVALPPAKYARKE